VLGALSPPAQKERDIANTHGVDLILGGHDHLYYVSRGISAWEGYDTTQDVLGAEDDRGDVLIIKVSSQQKQFFSRVTWACITRVAQTSETSARSNSSLSRRQPGVLDARLSRGSSVCRDSVGLSSSIDRFVPTGIHHETKPGSPSSERMKELLKDMLASVSSSLKVPVCRSAGTLDVRSQFIRTAEVRLVSHRHVY
jgi:5'-nucleotidase